jgi:hypothetical protein
MADAQRVPFIFLGSVVAMMVIAGTWPRGTNFGPVMIAAGALCIGYFVWRYRNPLWRQDPFWKWHPRLRKFVGIGFVPLFASRWLSDARIERANGLIGVLWGLGGIAIGSAQLAGLLPG